MVSLHTYVAWGYEQVLVDERVMFGTCVGC